MSRDDFLEYIADTGGWISGKLETIMEEEITIHAHGQPSTLEEFQERIDTVAEDFRTAAARAEDTLNEDEGDPRHDGFSLYAQAYEQLRALAYEEPDGPLPHDDRTYWENASARLQDLFEDDSVKKP